MNKSKINTRSGTFYAYTLQGWLKGVNSESLYADRDMGKDGNNIVGNSNKFFAKDAFGFSLGYHNSDYTPIDATATFLADKTGSNLLASTSNLYNGNIGNMVTTIVPPTLASGGTVTYAPAPQGTAYKYDRLNRLKSSQAWQDINAVGNVWATGNGSTYAGTYENNFSYDANGNITAQVRKDATGTAINDLTYNRRNAGGKTVQNRLYHVNDAVLNTTFTDDIDDQGIFTNNETVNTANNYGYDEIGNLNRNSQKQIAEMVYNVTGKVKEVHRTVGSTKENLKFDFDANGNRIAKHVYTSDDVWMHSDYYVNDAQGNNMAIYTLTGSSGSGLSYQLAERNIYGSSRVGTNKTPVEMIGVTLPVDMFSHTLGDRNYFLSSHTNNNLVTVTDRKLPIDLNNDLVIDEYLPHVISSADYYGFGVKMKERSFSTESMRYQFNNKEYDSETETTDFGARNSDGDLGIMETIDPKWRDYPSMSPYVYAANNPMLYVDENGEGPIVTLIRLGLLGPMTLSRITNKTIVASLSASAFLGAGVFLGGGGTASKGIAIDPQGNIGLIYSVGAFADFASGLGSSIDIGQGGVTKGNIALGGVLSATANLDFSTDNFITQLAGNNQQGSANSPEIEVGDIIAGGVSLGDNNFGVALGVGLGAAVSKLSTDNFLFATTLNDLDKFEDTFNEAFKVAKEKGGNVNYSITNSGKNQISISVTVTKGKEQLFKKEAINLKLDADKNTIKSSGVKETSSSNAKKDK